MSKKVRSSDAHSWNGGDVPSNGVGVGKRGWDTASMLMSFDLMSTSSWVISPDEVESMSMMSGHCMVEADVGAVNDVVSYHVLDVVLLKDLDVHVLKVRDVGHGLLLDVDVFCLSLLLDVDELM